VLRSTHSFTSLKRMRPIFVNGRGEEMFGQYPFLQARSHISIFSAGRLTSLPEEMRMTARFQGPPPCMDCVMRDM